MKRAYGLVVVAAITALVGEFPIQAQQKDPPKAFTNSIGMKFVWIQPGTFLMGSPKEEKGRIQIESQHQVTLTNGFYIGIYLVTQEQWQAVMGNNPSKYRGEKNLPVENVSWIDCQLFLEKTSKKEGRTYRLPTEAEWEFSYRAGTTTPYNFGETISTDQANFDGSSVHYGNGKNGVFRSRTTPVGSFPANAWGLYDMHGNLWQWCADVYAEYPQNAVVDPQGPYSEPPNVSSLIKKLSSPIFAERQAATKALKEIGLPALPALRKAARDGPDLETTRRVMQIIPPFSGIEKYRMLRGSSFFSPAVNVRSAYRFSVVATYRNDANGFRVVNDPTK